MQLKSGMIISSLKVATIWIWILQHMYQVATIFSVGRYWWNHSIYAHAFPYNVNELIYMIFEWEIFRNSCQYFPSPIFCVVAIIANSNPQIQISFSLCVYSFSESRFGISSLGSIHTWPMVACYNQCWLMYICIDIPWSSIVQHIAIASYLFSYSYS